MGDQMNRRMMTRLPVWMQPPIMASKPRDLSNKRRTTALIRWHRDTISRLLVVRSLLQADPIFEKARTACRLFLYLISKRPA